MTPADMVTEVRRQSNMPSTFGRMSDNEIMSYLNLGKNLAAQKIIQSDQKHFERDEKISFVANQEEYDIPRIFFKAKISLVERLRSDGTVLRRLDYIRFQERERYESTQVGVDGQGHIYFLRARKIGFKPKPTSAFTDAVKIYGIQFPQDMFWAKIPAIGADLTTTTFKMPASGADLKAGRLHTETDYYKNALIRVITGTAGRGIERRITAFNAATQVATIDTAWTTADVDTEEFVVHHESAEEYDEVMIQYAVMRSAAKQRDRALYDSARESFRQTYGSMEIDVEPRNYDMNEHILPPVDQWADYM